ncbi:MAG: hypothetical protein ACOC8H_00470, partial [bacterium]
LRSPRVLVSTAARQTAQQYGCKLLRVFPHPGQGLYVAGDVPPTVLRIEPGEKHGKIANHVSRV